MDEIVILLVVLVVWMTVICIFCSKWSKLRHLEPYHPDYRPSCSTTAQSPVYSVDSDNLAGVGALTTTPVASGAVGFGSGELDLTDSSGLLVGGTGGGGALSTSAAGQLTSVCAELNSALLASIPSCGQPMGLYQPAYSFDPGSQCALSTVLLPQQPSIDSTDYLLDTDPALQSYLGGLSAANDPYSDRPANRSKQVQFQSRHQSICAANFKPIALGSYPASALAANGSATNPFIRSSLGDMYTYSAAATGGSTITGGSFQSTTAPFFASSIDSSECNSYGPVEPGNVDVAPMFLNSDNYVIHQPSVDSIYIELPSRYHVRSGSATSMDGTMVTMTAAAQSADATSGGTALEGGSVTAGLGATGESNSGDIESARQSMDGANNTKPLQIAQFQFQQQLQQQLNMHLQQQLQQMQAYGIRLPMYASNPMLSTAGLAAAAGSSNPTIGTTTTVSSTAVPEVINNERLGLEQILEHSEEPTSEEHVNQSKKLLLRKGTCYRKIKRRRQKSGGDTETTAASNSNSGEEDDDNEYEYEDKGETSQKMVWNNDKEMRENNDHGRLTGTGSGADHEQSSNAVSSRRASLTGTQSVNTSRDRDRTRGSNSCQEVRINCEPSPSMLSESAPRRASLSSEDGVRLGSSVSGYSGSASSDQINSDAELLRNDRKVPLSVMHDSSMRRLSAYNQELNSNSSCTSSVGSMNRCASDSSSDTMLQPSVARSAGSYRKRNRLRKLETVMKRESNRDPVVRLPMQIFATNSHPSTHSMISTTSETSDIWSPSVRPQASTSNRETTGDIDRVILINQDANQSLSAPSSSSSSMKSSLPSSPSPPSLTQSPPAVMPAAFVASLGNLHQLNQNLQSLMSKFEIEVPPPTASALSAHRSSRLSQSILGFATPSPAKWLPTSTGPPLSCDPNDRTMMIEAEQAQSRRLRRFRSADDLIRHLGLHVIDNVQSMCKRKSYDILF